MKKIYLVVDNPERWKIKLEGVEVIAPRDYLTREEYFRAEANVFNLCRSYRYQGTGYYVSLLAEARGHKPMPDTGTLRDLGHRGILRIVSEEIDETMQSSLRRIKSDRFTLSIYFGRSVAAAHGQLARRLFTHFKAPLLRAQFARKEGDENHWEISNVFPISIAQIPEGDRGTVMEFARIYFARKHRHHRPRPPRYQMAILHDPKEKFPPSDPEALEKFIKAADRLDIEAELITRDDFMHLPSYDALFLRETTHVDHHTYRFSRQAEKDGLVVIDDPTSILRCANKVYLLELLKYHKLPAPRSMVLHRDNLGDVARLIGFPCILKLPDSSFSQGVLKATDEGELLSIAEKMMQSSALLVVQEFVPTPFDWRVGILDGKPLYACKYYMAAEHWQIYNNSASGTSDFTGAYETLRVEDAPKTIVQAALRAANLVGRGLYGVDLKEIKGKPSIIEVNDNPNIDSDVEDKVLGDSLYDRIMDVFNQRLLERTAVQQRRLQPPAR